jgi:hypothetical protein
MSLAGQPSDAQLMPDCRSVVGDRCHVDELRDAGDGELIEGRDPAGERVGEALDLAVRDDPVDVPELLT